MTKIKASSQSAVHSYITDNTDSKVLISYQPPTLNSDESLTAL
jgi:hypothetical protein